MENNEKILKCEIELDRIFYPKLKFEVESGEYAIFVASIINKIENCEDLKLLWGKSKIKLKGKVCKLESYVTYKVACKLVERHEQHGDTYEILFINKKIDLTNKSQQIDFLEGIINPNIVYKLFEKYDDVITLLEDKDIVALTSINGIGHATAMRIIEEFEDCKDYSQIYTELSNANLTANLIKKLLDFYKSPDIVVDIVKNNPYKLVEVSGIGFKKADEIAQKMGMVGNDSRRVKACIINTLAENGEIGKSYLHFSELMNIVFDQIGFIEQNIINDVAKQLIDNDEINISNNGQLIGLKRYYDLEMNIHNELIRLLNAEREDPFEIENWEDTIKRVEEEQGFEFTEEQIKTIRLIIENYIVALTGSAGTGKTATLNGVVKVFEDYIMSACALSGKASVRITEATGLNASTIHRLLGYSHGEFTYNEENPLDTDVVLIDETTMVNGDIFLSLLKAIPNGAKLIIVGDIKQLTPIGNCQVFSDILNSKTIPSITLTKIHRQAALSGIIVTSIKISEQTQIIKSNFEGSLILGELQDMELDIYKTDDSPSNRVIKHFLKHYETTHDIMETQILSPMRLKGDLSTYNLNNKIQSIINPVSETDIFIEVSIDKDKSYKIKLGDKVINTKNNYKSVNVDGLVVPIFNGNMGMVKEIDNGVCVVDFVGIGMIVLDRAGVKKLELAYVCTIHKSMGSGFNTAIVCIESSAYVLLNTEILYTGVTRAKKYCVLIGQNSAIRTAIKTREIKKKQTYLKELLKEETSY